MSAAIVLADTPERVNAVRALFVEYAQSLGCIGVRPLGGADDAWPIAELKRLYVRPQARGTGLGKRLTRAALDFARNVGHRAIRLDTLPAMQSAIRLYETLGFLEIAPYYANPIPGARYLELALTGGACA